MQTMTLATLATTLFLVLATTPVDAQRGGNGGGNGGGPEPKPECSDGYDNDGDRLVDMADPDCTSKEDTGENGAACADKIDNDGDGETDFPYDDDCSGYADNDESGPLVPSVPYPGTYAEGSILPVECSGPPSACLCRYNEFWWLNTLEWISAVSVAASDYANDTLP